MPARSLTMARFDEGDDSKPEFVCSGCGYAFDLPREDESVRACDCGKDLCPDCAECEDCRKATTDKDDLTAGAPHAENLGKHAESPTPPAPALSLP